MTKNFDLDNSSEVEKIFDVVVIGAGISGALFAQYAFKQGKKVCIVDKARGSGGRLSAKRVALDSSNIGTEGRIKDRCNSNDGSNDSIFLGFDLGCSYFDINSPELEGLVLSWLQGGLIQKSGDSKLLPLKRSSFLTRSLIEGIHTEFATRITRIEKKDGYWYCYAASEDEEILILATQKLVLAMPAPQVADLIPSSPYKLPVQSVQYQAQWVIMAALPEHIELDKLEDEVFFNGDIAQINCEASKPERQRIDGLKIWVVHFSPQWTRKHIDWDKGAVENYVKEMLEKFTFVKAIYAHRWLYSQVQSAMHTANGILKLDEGLYAIGDWLRIKGQSAKLGGVETAILSSTRLIAELDSELN